MGARSVRFLFVLCILPIAGCDVVSRDTTELERLRIMDRYLADEEWCELSSFLRSNPEDLRGSDPLAEELRDFVGETRIRCTRPLGGDDDDADPVISPALAEAVEERSDASEVSSADEEPSAVPAPPRGPKANRGKDRDDDDEDNDEDEDEDDDEDDDD